MLSELKWLSIKQRNDFLTVVRVLKIQQPQITCLAGLPIQLINKLLDHLFLDTSM